ncbi:hypothetical protein ACLOJK_003432, partial [Asimina triloba]
MAGLLGKMKLWLRCSGGASKFVPQATHALDLFRPSERQRRSDLNAAVSAPDPYHPAAQTTKHIAAGVLLLGSGRIRISSGEDSSNKSPLLPSSSLAPAKLSDGENPSKMGVSIAAVDKIYFPQIRSDLNASENPTLRPLPSSPTTNHRCWGKTIRSGMFSTHNQNPSVSANARRHLYPRGQDQIYRRLLMSTLDLGLSTHACRKLKNNPYDRNFPIRILPISISA